MANDLRSVRTALARALADRKIADDVVDIAAKQLAAAKQPIRRIDVCTYGICIDFFIDSKEWWKILPEMIELEGGQLKGIEVFPWGIINPDMFHIRVTQNLDVMPQIRV
ncbi:MAG: hypothetical protein HC853_06030 [Anaerolineae bacterium]|nr:hypothetical protein [Anaerolineae bacterium]